MICDQVGGLLGAYALDAVEADEATAVERHLLACRRCADEVASHRDTAWRLANAGGEAPPELWDRIAATIGSSPSPARKLPPTLTPLRAAPPGRPSRRRLAIRSLAAGAAAAAAAVIALLGVRVAHLDHQMGQLSAAARASGGFQGAAAALTNPDARRLALTSTASTEQLGELVILPSGSAYLLDGRLPALPPTKTYQLWSVKGGTAISVGLLGDHPTTVGFTLGPQLQATDLLVTVEPAGGVVAPTSPPVAQARL